MRLLLDEMYPPPLAAGLDEVGIDAVTVTKLRLTGASDPEVFEAAIESDRVLLTENVADFTRLVADRLSQGRHHPGILIALSSRFSRRPSGRRPLVRAIRATASDEVADRVVFLAEPEPLA